MAHPIASSKTRRLVSAWFPCKDGGKWEDLAPHADVLGSVSTFGDEPAAGFVNTCHEHDILAIKLVGGKATAFDTDAHARDTMEGYLRVCQEAGLDGIDLDFEHVGAEFTDRYTQFVRELSEALHAVDKRLSICVGSLTPPMYAAHPDWLFYDPVALGEVCDEVRVMCYDMFCAGGTWYGPTSTCPWARESMLWWLQRVPRERLIMALPAYSNEYETTPGCGNGRQQGIDSPHSLPGTHNVEVLWCEYEKINIYRYLDAEDRPHLFFASDGKSTSAHLETVDELDMPGISFWHYGSMSPGIWDAVMAWLG